MGRTDVVAHDPSVADYHATSPRFAQGGIQEVSIPTVRISWSERPDEALGGIHN